MVEQLSEKSLLLLVVVLVVGTATGLIMVSALSGYASASTSPENTTMTATLLTPNEIAAV